MIPTPEQIAAVLIECQGKPALAAQRLGLTLAEVEQAINDSPQVAQAAREAQRRAEEAAELAFQAAVLRGEKWAVQEAAKRESAKTSKDSRGWLTDDQKQLVNKWLASGVHKFQEINALAAEQDPPFGLSWAQFKQARKKAGIKVTKLREEATNKALTDGLAIKGKRVATLKGLITRHLKLIEERAEAMDGEIEGGETGLLARDFKGESLQPVYKFDAAVIKELRELMKQIAVELGEWTEKKELSGPDGTALLDPLAAALEKAYGNGNK